MKNIIDRTPPHSIESEISFLGSILKDGSKMIDVFDDIRNFYFYKSTHQKIYNAMETVFKKGDDITIEAVQNELVRTKEIDDIGGIDILYDLADSIPSSASIASYAKIIKEKWIYRNVIVNSHNILSKAYDQVETDELLEEIGKLSLIDNITVKEDSWSDILHKFNDEIEARGKGEYKSGIKTGLNSLDNLVNEFHNGELITLAGHTSSGKTALSLQIANYNCIGLGKHVGIVGMEMTKKEYAARLLSINSGINLSNILLGRLRDTEWQSLAMIQGKIYDAGFHISDKPRMGIHEIRSLARQWKRKHDIELLIIDNMINMQLPKSDSTANSIDEATQELKGLTKELDIPTIILAHISRDHERKYRRPTMQNLLGSSAYERNSDTVMFVWIPYKYDYDIDNGQAEVFIDKRRNGATGTTNNGNEYTLKFIKECAMFKDSTPF